MDQYILPNSILPKTARHILKFSWNSDNNYAFIAGPFVSYHVGLTEKYDHVILIWVFEKKEDMQSAYKYINNNDLQKIMYKDDGFTISKYHEHPNFVDYSSYNPEKKQMLSIMLLNNDNNKYDLDSTFLSKTNKIIKLLAVIRQIFKFHFEEDNINKCAGIAIGTEIYVLDMRSDHDMQSTLSIDDLNLIFEQKKLPKVLKLKKCVDNKALLDKLEKTTFELAAPEI